MKNKKKVLVIALVLCLVALLSVGTIAWFSSEDSVENKFYVADSTDVDPDDIFSVDVWENTPDGTEDQDGYEYEDILPGDVLDKEPHIENTGHYDQYIRAIVTISDYEAWKAVIGEDFAPLFAGFDASKWESPIEQIKNADGSVTYVLYYKDVLKSGDEVVVFTDVLIPESLTQEQAAEFDGGFTVEVKAQAVQTENVGDNAKAAFDTVGLAID